MSVTVSTSASIALSTTDGTAETVDSYTSEFSASIGYAPDSSDVAMELGGEATAIGDDTLALGSMEATLDATGSVTTAYGSATFVAASESPSGETAFAIADSYGFVSGMDFLAVITSDTQIVQEGPDGSLWVATSETTLYGVDLDLAANDLASGVSETSDFESSAPPTSDPLDSDPDPLGDDWIDFEGNIAVLDIDADVSGSDTLLLVAADVLTIEDSLSTVVADLLAAVG